MYILGILTGLLLAIICMLSVRKYQTPLERTTKQILNKVQIKGEIYGLEDTSMEDLIEQFKENKDA